MADSRLGWFTPNLSGDVTTLGAQVAREAFELAAAKLPIPVKIVTRPAYLPIREEVVYEMMPEEDLDAPVTDDGELEAASDEDSDDETEEVTEAG